MRDLLRMELLPRLPLNKKRSGNSGEVGRKLSAALPVSPLFIGFLTFL